MAMKIRRCWWTERLGLGCWPGTCCWRKSVTAVSGVSGDQALLVDEMLAAEGLVVRVVEGGGKTRAQVSRVSRLDLAAGCKRQLAVSCTSPTVSVSLSATLSREAERELMILHPVNMAVWDGYLPLFLIGTNKT